MIPAIIDSVVLETIQASAADVSIIGDTIRFNGLGTPISLRNALQHGGYQAIPFAAGTAKQMTFTFANVDNSTDYTMQLPKYPSTDPTLQVLANDLTNGIERYGILSDASATPTTVAAQFAAAITKAIQGKASWFATATSSGAVLTIVGGSAASDFYITLNQTVASNGSSVGTAAVSVAWIPTNGTYAQVAAINKNAISTSTYDTYIFRFNKSQPDNLLRMGDSNWFDAQVNVYLKVGATNIAALETEIAAIAGGTHTPASDYLGIYQS